MVVEIADFRVDPKHHEAFGDALRKGVETVLSKAKGYRSHRVLACIESPGRYVLSVDWDSVHDHVIGFRESAAFAEWRSLIGPFFAAPPIVEHFTAIAQT